MKNITIFLNYTNYNVQLAICLTTLLQGRGACGDPGVTMVNPTEISVMYGYLT